MSNSTVRPWVRFFARNFDLMIWGFVISIILYFVWPNGISSMFVFPLIVYGTWIIAESVIMTLWGRTLGKYLFNIEIHHEGVKPKFNNYLKRSFTVCWRGCAVGLPLLSFITYFISYTQLIKHNVTAWDRETKFIVKHSKLSWAKITIVVITSIIYGIIVFKWNMAHLG